MWFRNLVVYRLPAPWAIDSEAFAERLAGRALPPCGAIEAETRGWVPPVKGGSYLHVIGGQWLIRLGSEHKLLPSSVVKQFVEDRAIELEEQQGFKPGRRQLRELKERVTDELLPRAFVRRRSEWAWIDPVDGWLVVDAASDARAEAIVEMLRDTLDELPLRRFDTERSPCSAMTEWVAEGDAPAGFTVDRELELRAPDEEKATVRYLRHDLEGEEIAAHIRAGKRATRLAMTWSDRVSFVLADSGHLRRLAFLDVVKESLDGTSGDGDAEFAAQFALMTGELRRMLPAVAEALGGERAVDVA
ncbi:MAG: recombination-associated protein RdgC [Rhodocyclaceae bacterium]|nr:recombination-associated protein RdgC [Rhodocyclaceae bacterium]